MRSPRLTRRATFLLLFALIGLLWLIFQSFAPQDPSETASIRSERPSKSRTTPHRQGGSSPSSSAFSDDDSAHVAPEGTPITGRVLDSRGWPVVARVSCISSPGDCEVHGDASFTCSCPGEEVTLLAIASDQGQATATARPGEDVTLTLSGLGWVAFTVQADGPVPDSVEVESSLVGSEVPARQQRAEVEEDGTVLLSLPQGVHTASVWATGYDRTRLPSFALRSGETRDLGTVVLTRPGTLQGQVVTERGAPVPFARIEVDQEGELAASAVTDSSGRFSTEVPSGPARVRALRRDGLLLARSPEESVSIPSGGRVEVRLILPSRPAAGLGIRIAEADGGIEVEGLVPGGPAEGLGLLPGDLIVEAEGKPTEGETVEEFAGRVIGEAGTEVRLVVERDGQRREIRGNRQELPIPEEE